MRFGNEQSKMPNFTLLLEELNSDNPATYISARDEFLESREEVLPVLIKIMLDQADRQGWRAAMVIAAMEDVTTVSAFIQALKSPSALIRQLAAQMLGDLGDGCAIPYLLEQLGDENIGVQIWVVEFLGNLRAREAVELLYTLITKTDSAELQRTIIKAFGRIGDADAAAYLVPFFKSPDHHVSKKAYEIYQQLTSSSTGS